MGSFRTTRYPGFNGDLIHIFNGLDDGSVRRLPSTFGNASAGRTRTARYPPPRRPVRRRSP